MKSNSISGIDSIKDLESQLESFETLNKFSEFLGLDQSKEISKLKQELGTLKSLPDTFNKYFSNLGWIAHESLSIETMETAIKNFEESGMSNAENYLIEYYEQFVPELINRIKYRPLYKDRAKFFQYALNDYFEGRYYASIPLILMNVDGLVNDVKATGLFAENTNLDVWDSIAGHSTGLSRLVKIITKSRNKTISEKIDLPYRNGILHGRDLGYDNKLVAAKCLVLIAYIHDWIQSLQSEQERKNKFFAEKEEIENTSLSELVRKIVGMNKKRAIDEKLLKEWRPRSNIDLCSSFDIDSPEYSALKFFEYIKEGNYGKPANYYPDLIFEDGSISQKAGALRQAFSNIQILNAKVEEIRDEAPAISEIVLKVCCLINEEEMEKNAILRMLYEIEGTPSNRLMEGGNWKIVNIEGIHWLLKS